MILKCFLSIKKAAKNARMDNMSEEDFARDKDYYRDILKEYSAAELSYVDDFKVGHRREIVSTILNLQLKNKITIANNEIIIIDSNAEGLKKTEQYILKNIINGRVKIDNAAYIESYAQDEALEDRLIKKNTEEEKNKRRRKVLTQIGIKLGIIIILFVLLNIYNDLLFELSTIVYWIAIVLLSLGIFDGVVGDLIYYFVYSLMQENSYSRTEEGEELNKKLEGLKKFILDYSLLSEKSQNSLQVWNEYLIYSVIFDINKTNIKEEIMQLVDIEFEYWNTK